MKKYTTFPIDCSILATETMVHLKEEHDIESVEYQTQAFHLLAQDDISALAQSIPSLSTTFPGLTIKLVAHITVNTTAMFNTQYEGNILLIPMEDCGDLLLKTFTVAPGAVKTDWAYRDEDCTADESIPLNDPAEPIFIASGLVHTIEKVSPNLGDVLLIVFDGDTDSYLA